VPVLTMRVLRRELVDLVGRRDCTISESRTRTKYSYDNAGNMTGDAAYTYSYDAENRTTSANGVTYTYDGDGLRVEKSSGTLYWRSITGDALAESDLQGNITNEYVFFAARRIARISSGTVNYFYSDALGTVHTITDATGHPCYDASFTPYGLEVPNPNITQTCSSNYKFTGYEYDSETGLYYGFARYYNPRLGRFMSADPLGGDSGAPQTLNRYAYVVNSPTNFTDPSGLWCDPGFTPCGQGSWDSSPIPGGDNEFDFLGISVGSDTTGWSDGQCVLNCYGSAINLFLQIQLPAGIPLELAPSLTPPPFKLQNPCGAAPAAPTAAIDVNTNIQQGEAAAAAAAQVPGVSSSYLTSFWLYGQFKTGGPQDYKTSFRGQYADFGNFNYGAVCGATGFSLTYCQSAAGLGLMGRTSYKDAEYGLGLSRQHYKYNGAGIPFLKAPYGDQPGDADQIAFGYAYQLCLNGG